MRYRYSYPLYTVFLLLFFACREAYISPVNSSTQNLLVVEGILNSGDTSTTIVLSRSVKLLDTAEFVPETGALVSVESEQQEVYPLTETGNGRYWSPGLPLNSNLKYRLLITTDDGKRYASDFIPVVDSPPIDSIGWDRDADKVTIHASTHDPGNSTRYYRWDFNETWEFHSPFYSGLEYVNFRLIERRNSDEIYYCWKTRPSSQILVTNTLALGQDRVHKFPITRIVNGEVKLTVKYSIEVFQYALTKEAYEYWQILKKNTESVGSIFDPQPSLNVSNIHNIDDPDEIVIGYLSAGLVRRQRIFIDNSEVPGWHYFANCFEEKVSLDSLQFFFGGGQLIPTLPDFIPPGQQYTHVLGTTPVCVDCRLTGTNVKPDFWP